jgi:hypothetical protein
MVIHALMDMHSGHLGYVAFRDRPERDAGDKVDQTAEALWSGGAEAVDQPDPRTSGEQSERGESEPADNSSAARAGRDSGAIAPSPPRDPQRETTPGTIDR